MPQYASVVPLGVSQFDDQAPPDGRDLCTIVPSSATTKRRTVPEESVARIGEMSVIPPRGSQPDQRPVAKLSASYQRPLSAPLTTK